MENGHEERKLYHLADKISGLSLNDTSAHHNYNQNQNDSSLFQVMKAVEAAEATIKQQAEENTRLRNELLDKIQQLEKYKFVEPLTRRPHFDDAWNNQVHQPGSSAVNQEDNFKSKANISRLDPSSVLVLPRELKPQIGDPASQSHAESLSNSSKINGTLKVLSSGQAPVDNAGVSQLSSPSAASVSPNRYQIEGEYDPRFNMSGHGLMQMAEVNNPGGLWKQEFALKTREQEEEIMQLRKHLADYSVKEAQIRNEKYVLEKRIAYMRLAFDQQQQDLVDAASKALSYRQDIIEENIRLTYELQAAQQERSTFASSLLPLLAEYSLQPPVPDALSIVSNVKVLFKHLQEKLIHTESKLKESQYQLAPWHSDVGHSNFAPQSPSHSAGAALTTLNKNGLELVPQPTYSHAKIPMTSSDTQTAADWDLLSHHQSGMGGAVAKNLDPDDVGRYSPLASRNSAAHDMPAHFAVTRGDAQAMHYGEEPANKQVMFRDPVGNSEMDDPEGEGHHNEREPPVNWGPGNPAYATTLDDPSSSYSPYLPPVLEEPSSSFSEAADEDPLPAIDGLQISGEASPGRELQACGYSIHGTTSCNFEWVRHLEDGSVNYIEGAKQPNYLVTADDVDTYLAIEVQPLDDRKRKGELVKVFANEHRKIRCDPEMHDHIQKALNTGHVSFKVALSAGFIDIWEPAMLAIKREGYSIKSEPNGGVVTEKFSVSTSVTIPYGHASEFIIIDSGGRQHLLQAYDNLTDINWYETGLDHCTRCETGYSGDLNHAPALAASNNGLYVFEMGTELARDTIVLTLRLFIKQFGEKRKGKKRGLFFNK